MNPQLPLSAILASLAFASGVFAQTPAPSASSGPAGQDTVKLETFTVTGSNIRRTEVEKVLPVTVFTQADLEIRDPGQTSDLIAALPISTGIPLNETANATQNARGDNAAVSFRGLASGNTLVLLNGRRMVPHPISASERSIPALSVNVNTLPSRGLQSVEILRDGASSVYGSDAVAGVMNFRMNLDFRGTELSVRYRLSGYRDGDEIGSTLTHGREFAGGKGRMVVTADFYNRRALFQSARPFSQDGDKIDRAPAPWNVYSDTTFNGRTTTSEYGQFSLGTVTGYNEFGSPLFTAARPTGIPAAYAATSGTFYLLPQSDGSVTIGTAAPVRAASGPGRDYFWNLAGSRLIQPQSTRGNLFISTEYDLSSRLTAFGDFSAYQSHSISYRDPDVYQSSSNGPMIVPVTNPFNPFGNRYWSPTGAPNADGTPRLTGTPTAVSIVSHRFADFGLRTDVITNSLYRGVVGLKGKLAGSWTWDGAVVYGRGRAIEYEPAARISLMQVALNQTDPAKALNPFERTYAVKNGTLVDTGSYVNSATVKNAVYGAYIRNGITGLASVDFRASGDLFSLWGGNRVGGAIGGEYRGESYDDYRPPYVGLNPPGSGLDPTISDFVSASSVPDTHGSRRVSSLFAETVVPLVGREFTLPLVRSLELSAAARYENYTNFNGATRPKYGVNWKPFSWLMVRASENRGFRAPSLVSMFKGSYTAKALGHNDVYRSVVTGLLTDQQSNRNNRVTGNANLKPERAEGKSAGVVIDVPRIKGLSLSVDYWEIRQRDIFATSGTINDDRDALLAATQAALAAGQNINSIDLASGTAGYKGDPSAVVRLPVTQQDRDLFAAYNAKQSPGNQRAVVGAIDYLLTTYTNKAMGFVNGFDFNATYRLPRTFLGNFTFDTRWTRMLTFYSKTTQTSPRTELLESNTASAGGASPQWRGNATVSWRRQQWGGGVGMYYIGRYCDSGATTTKGFYDSLGQPSYLQPFFTGGAYTYRYVVRDTKSYNVFLSYRIESRHRWLNQTSIRFGVNNVLNAQPPLSSASEGYDSAVYNGIARGRDFSLQFTKKL